MADLYAMHTGTWRYKFVIINIKYPISNIRCRIFILLWLKCITSGACGYIHCILTYQERRMTSLILTRLGYFPSHMLQVVYVMMKGRALTWILLEMDPVRAVCRTTTGSPGILPWVKTKQRRYDPTRRFRSVMSRIGCTASYWEICNRNRSTLRLW